MLGSPRLPRSYLGLPGSLQASNEAQRPGKDKTDDRLDLKTAVLIVRKILLRSD